MLTEQILAQHLAHGTYVEHTSNSYVSNKMVKIVKIESLSSECVTFHSAMDWYFNTNENECSIKLCLRPLSQLTEPITEGGKTFVPLIELARPTAKSSGYNNSLEIYKGKCRCYTQTTHCDFSFNGRDFNFGQRNVYNQFGLFQQLLSWHFNLFLKEGEYKQVNNDFNPYA